MLPGAETLPWILCPRGPSSTWASGGPSRGRTRRPQTRWPPVPGSLGLRSEAQPNLLRLSEALGPSRGSRRGSVEPSRAQAPGLARLKRAGGLGHSQAGFGEEPLHHPPTCASANTDALRDHRGHRPRGQGSLPQRPRLSAEGPGRRFCSPGCPRTKRDLPGHVRRRKCLLRFLFSPWSALPLPGQRSEERGVKC